MDELIKNFHIDWRLLIAQIVNFAIVVGTLWFFALKPLTKKMNERTGYIEKSLKDAQKVEENLAKVEELKKEKLVDAAREAERMIREAKKAIEARKKEAIEKTREEASKIISEAKDQINIEKEKTTKEIKNKISELIISSLKKILGEGIDKKMEEQLIKKTIEAIKK